MNDFHELTSAELKATNGGSSSANSPLTLFMLSVIGDIWEGNARVSALIELLLNPSGVFLNFFVYSRI